MKFLLDTMLKQQRTQTKSNDAHVAIRIYDTKKKNKLIYAMKNGVYTHSRTSIEYEAVRDKEAESSSWE